MRWLGEPLRSVFRPRTLCRLLAKYELEIVRDRSVAEIGRELSSELGASTQVAHHLRVAVARRR